MYRRKRNRLKMVLAVRAKGQGSNGIEFDELTHTLDIAADGVRLGGMDRLSLNPGDIVELRRKTRRATFRVAWVGEPGTARTGHVGLHALDIHPDFWGLEVPAQGEVAIPVSVHSAHPEHHAG